MSTKEKRSAFDAACDYLSRLERTEAEVRDKLFEKGYEEDEIDEAVQKLNEAHYLDDHGFAVRYIEFALAKGRGMRRIRDELRRKGIDSFVVEDAVYELAEEGQLTEDSGRERALEQAQSIASGKEIDEKLIAKVGRRLQTQGFESGEIYYAIGKLRDSSKNKFF